MQTDPEGIARTLIQLQQESERMIRVGLDIYRALMHSPGGGMSSAQAAAPSIGSADQLQQGARTRVVFSQYGQKEREILLRDDDSVATEWTYSFDGRVQSETKFLDDGATAYCRSEFDALQNKKESFLSADGIPFREGTFRFDNVNGAYVQQSETTFCSDGKTAESSTRFRFDGSKEIEQLYAADGKTLFAETRFRSDGMTVESIRTFLEDGSKLLKYASDGQLSEAHDFDATQKLAGSVRFRADGTVFTSTVYKSGIRLLESEFASDGKTLVSETRFSEDGSTRISRRELANDGQTPKKESIYDAGRIVRTVEYDGQGKTSRIRDLNPDGTIKRDLEVAGDESKPVKELTYHREGALPVKIELLFENGAPLVENKYDALERLLFTRHFDDNGKPARETHYWGTGSPRLSAEYRDGVKIAEREYHAGTTRVRLETVFSGYNRTETEFRSDGSLSYRKKYDWQQRLREEEIFDGSNKPVRATTFYDNGNTKTEVHYGHDGSIQHNYSNDGKRVNDLFFDKRGYVNAEMTYFYDGEKLTSSIDSSGKKYIFATDNEDKVHRFDNNLPTILPLDIVTGIPPWRLEQLYKRADLLLEAHAVSGSINFEGLARILTSLADSTDLTEQEKANVWTDIVSRSKRTDGVRALTVTTGGASRIILEGDFASNIRTAVLPFNDGFLGPLALLNEDLARNHIQLRGTSNRGRRADDRPVDLANEIATSLHQISALRAFLRGGMSAYASEWVSRFCQEPPAQIS